MSAGNRRNAWCLAAVVLLALSLKAVGQTASLSLQKIDLSLLPKVQLYFTATDDKGRSILGLTDQEISVRVDGQPQRITRLESALTQGQALAVVLAIDRSGSMAAAMTDVRKAAIDFVRRLSLEDEVAVVSFDDTVSLEAGFSRDRLSSEQAISRVKLGRDTALYDAVQMGLDLLRTSGRPRQAVVILSDGKDNRSRRTAAEIRAEANNRSVPLFTIGLGPDIDQAVLRDLAAQTGGGFFKAAALQDLWQLYQTIAEQLTNQYLLSFELGKGGDERWHNLEVSLKTPSGGAASTERRFIASLGPGVSLKTLQSLQRKEQKADVIETALLGGAAGLLAGVVILLVVGLARRRFGMPLLVSLALLLAFILLGAALGLILFSRGLGG